MTEQQKQWFDALTQDRAENARVMAKSSMCGIRSVLTELYPDNAHFIYELLQNAEDAGAKTVRFTLTDTCVEFEHDGTRLFSEQDIESITSIGTSTKKDDPTAIGKFGVGFKAVFAYTQTPEIHSGDFHFKIRDLVVPEAIPPCGVVSGKTSFIFPFDNPKKHSKTAVAEIERGLRELADNTLLFLLNIQEIEYLLPDGQTLGSLKRIDLDGQPSSPANGHHIEIHALQPGMQRETVTHWLRYSKAVIVTDEDEKQKACRIGLAFKLKPQTTSTKDENNAEPKDAKKKATAPKAAWEIVPCDPGQVSIFFPCVGESSGLRFNLHAPFASTVARDVIRKECSANNRLRDELAQLITEVLPDIRDHGLLTMEFLAVLPIPDDRFTPFYEPIRQAVVNAFNERDLTPVKGGGHKKSGELYRGPADISAFIDDDGLALLAEAQPPRLWAANAPQRNGRADKFLASLGIAEWSWDQLAEAFSKTDRAKKIESWIAEKGDNWLLRFYCLLYRLKEQTHIRWEIYTKPACSRLKLVRVETEKSASEPKAPLHSFDDVNLDNIHPVCHVIPQEVFFPQGRGVSAQKVPFVKPEVYAKNGSDAQKTAAREFLKCIGVREYDERVEIERRLKAYPVLGGSKRIDDSHFADIRSFVAYWIIHPSESGLFMGYHFLLGHKHGDSQLWRKKPADVCLDAPYVDTGLAVLSGIHAKFVLAANYLDNLGAFSAQDFIAFLKAIDVMHGFDVEHTHVYKNSKIESFIGDRELHTTTNKDWTINNISEYTKAKTIEASRLIWRALLNASSEAACAVYQPNRQARKQTADSQLVQHLKAAAWIPGKDGVFRTPQDMTPELLPNEFPYDDQNGLLTAIGFGENARKRSAEHQARETKAKELGFNSAEDAKRAQELLQAEKEGRLQIAPSHPPEFPDNPVPDPARRSAKVVAEAAAATTKIYAMCERSVRRSKVNVAAALYLSNNYTNEDGQMVCLCCQKEMPFRKRDGKPYFEAVEAFGRDDVDKEHEAQHLALCPLCAAKYKEFVKSDDIARQALKEHIQNAPKDQREFDIALDVPARLRFTEPHLIDLRAVLSYQGTNDV